jgi:SAM-dependent methyltransferase
LPKDFFDSDLVVATYDLLTEQANRQISGDVSFYLDCAARFGSPVLELGVGTGRIAWALAEANHYVVGVDRSKRMLERAKEKGSDYPGAVRRRVDLIEADITGFDIDRTFPLVLIPFSTFQHLTTPRQQRACLDCIHRHVGRSGRVILDVFDPILDACVPGAATPNPDREAVEPETGHVLRRTSMRRVNDPLTQTFVETFRLERWDGCGQLLSRDEATHHLRWATRQEMLYLFELTGFEAEAEYADFNGREPAYGQRQIWRLRPRHIED